MQSNIWKEIFGTYEVSKFGVVKNKKRGTIVSQRIRNGYPSVILYVDGLPKTMAVHRLVALAFIPNPDNKPQVNHINGVKAENWVGNLEWVTQGENNSHAYKNGLASKKGEQNNNSKLTKSDVIKIKELSLKGSKQSELATKFNVTQATISRVINSVNWGY